MLGVAQSHSNQYIPPYLPPQYGSVVVEGLKSEHPIQTQQAASYQSLPVVNNSDPLSQLINVSHTSNMPSIPFLTNLSTQVHSSNGMITQNGISTTQAFGTSPDTASKTFFVQMENGNYQVRSDVTLPQ